MSRRSTRPIVLVSAAVGLALLACVGPAHAHIGTSQDTVVAGQSATVDFSVGHGCDGSPTTAVSFQVPDSIVSAKPYAHPGWDIAVERAPLAEPLAQEHGDPLTDRPAIIRFTAQPGHQLPDDVRDRFTLRFRAPDTPGETLFFKVVQICEAGENAWIAEWDGQGEEPEHPAPSIDVVAAEAPDEPSDAQPVNVATSGRSGSEADDDDSSSATGVAIAALGVGVAGAGLGGAALMRTRRARS